MEISVFVFFASVEGSAWVAFHLFAGLVGFSCLLAWDWSLLPCGHDHSLFFVKLMWEQVFICWNAHMQCLFPQISQEI